MKTLTILETDNGSLTLWVLLFVDRIIGYLNTVWVETTGSLVLNSTFWWAKMSIFFFWDKICFKHLWSKICSCLGGTFLKFCLGCMDTSLYEIWRETFLTPWTFFSNLLHVLWIMLDLSVYYSFSFYFYFICSSVFNFPWLVKEMSLHALSPTAAHALCWSKRNGISNKVYLFFRWDVAKTNQNSDMLMEGARCIIF